MSSNNIKSLDLVTPPNDLLAGSLYNYNTGAFGGCSPGPRCTSVQLPKAGPFDYSAIQAFLRKKLRDGFLAKENAGVVIYNATKTSGVATKESKLLKTLGYQVIKIDNTPKTTDPATTVIVDLTDGNDKYTRHYLENRFHVVAVKDLPRGLGLSPPVGTDFVIILGKDAISTTSQ